MRRIQAEHAEWVGRLYPGQTPEFPAAGMVEEAGELMRAVLKCQQANGAKHPEARYAGVDWNAAFADAVGDCAIYCCSLCNTNGWDFEKLVDDAKLCPPKTKSVFLAAAELVAIAADVCSEPTLRSTAVCYISRLIGICDAWGVDFGAAVRATWEEVKCRK